MRSLVTLIILCIPTLAADPLPSWNDTPNKKAILDFVAKVTK